MHVFPPWRFEFDLVHMCSTSEHTAHNKRFSEMAVGVETETRLHPLTAYGILRCGAPNPPLRQAAGRYVQYTLVQWNTDGDFF